MLGRGEPFEAALPAALKGVVAPADRALAHAIAASVLRWRIDLDSLIDSATARPLPDDAKARAVLQMALAQALLLKTPMHAVIATALPLLEGGPRRLVHGVLSTLSKRQATLPPLPTLPPGIDARWRSAWGHDIVAAAQAALASEAPTDITLARADVAAPDGASLLPLHRRIVSGGRVEGWPGFADGGWWVQDLAASLPARLLGAAPGDAVADLCAAPGGKTLQLAAAGARVTAVDMSQSRLARLRDNLARTGLAAETVCADATRWRPAQPPDHILLDAPCSASGIFRRHPDVLATWRAQDLPALVALQARLIDHALDLLRPGGRLLFCTCSLEPEEGEMQLAALGQRRSDWRLERVRTDELPAGLMPSAGGALRTLPGQLADAGGLDAFFIARIEKA